MIEAGYWNIGAGAGREWAQLHTNMQGIVKPLLEDGFPVLDLSKARDLLPEPDVVGTHDFSSFVASGSQTKDHVRTIYEATVRQSRGSIEFNPLSIPSGEISWGKSK